jgi:tripartite-type tricarboxylate transporter receptor subunit TctC
MRSSNCLLIFIASLALNTTVAATDYPSRPIRFIVPSAPGGAPDMNSRLLASELTKQMGQQVVVDNRPGASQIIGMDLLAKAPPDGYTIGYGTSTGLASNRNLFAKLPYDPDRDFQVVAQLLVGLNVLVVTPSMPVSSVQDFIQYARSNPGKLTFGSAGSASSEHLSAELFKQMTGTDLLHVPYKASQDAIRDLSGARIQLIFENVGAVLPHLKANRIRALGVTSLKRSSVLPDVPTISEAGLPGYELTTFAGVIVPAGVPNVTVSRLNAEINKAIADTRVREKYAAIGYELVGGSPQEFSRHIQKEAVRWGDLIKRTGAKLE